MTFMIRIDDLKEAIAECEGERNPNANTCIKLAAYYTILQHMTEKEPPETMPVLPQNYSFASYADNETVQYESDSEFSQVIHGKEVNDVLQVMDELMTTLQGIIPRLYDGVMRKLDK